MHLRFIALLSIMILVTVSCKKEEELADPLSYLKLLENLSENEVLEQSRTQIMSLTRKNNITTLKVAFAMDSIIPEQASKSSQNAYAIRFTLQDSLKRSKKFGGGTFILKFKKVGNKYSVRNFQKSSPLIVRYPEYSIDSMDTIVNPEIIDVRDGKTNTCILQGCNGSLTPLKNNVYSITLVLKDIEGDVWSLDHGYINEDEKTKEPTKIMNKTGLGIKIAFPSTNQKTSAINFDLDKLGVNG